jgi:hypothetical protein
MNSPLAIVETHPVQYHAPVWREAAQALGVPLQVIYGGDFSVRGYRDREFGASFQWEADLLAGYASQILQPAAADYESVTAQGLEAALTALQPAAVLSLGYHHPLDRAAIRWATHQQRPLLHAWRRPAAPLFQRRVERRCRAAARVEKRRQRVDARVGALVKDHVAFAR